MAKKGRNVVLGAGPAGLAAAVKLAREGERPLVLERAPVPGGLMRSIERGDYRVDVGRKELYARLPEVHELWSGLLGDDYREYPHRVGVLYEGTIIERSRSFRGFWRGMPRNLVFRGGLDFVLRQAVNPLLPPPSNEEEYWYRVRGRVFSEVLSQGHAEKFQGIRWSEQPAPEAVKGAGLVKSAARAVFGRAVAKDHGNTVWRHPARSTGQIIDRLVETIAEEGGELKCGASVTSLEMSGDRVKSVVAEIDGEVQKVPVDSLVSSVPLNILATLLGREPPQDIKGRDTKGRSTILVYLFLDHPPKFPHAWLDVTDPGVKAGRITNYAGFNGRMVPPGKTCLAVEYFVLNDDPMLSLPNDASLGRAVEECVRSGLIDATKLTDHMVLKLRGAFAADDYRSWTSPGVVALLERVAELTNLYNVNRAGTDVATYAGLEAAHAIHSGDRARFDERADPRRKLGIDSTRLY
ncbi:MAG: FAD-dependent oxidoreductase [Myxococcota bacterium]